VDHCLQAVVKLVLSASCIATLSSLDASLTLCLDRVWSPILVKDNTLAQDKMGTTSARSLPLDL
jgi:hypothetical protein